MHWPAQQPWFAPHVCPLPQPPQLLLSLAGLLHWPPQQFSPLAHTLLHDPQ